MKAAFAMAVLAAASSIVAIAILSPSLITAHIISLLLWRRPAARRPRCYAPDKPQNSFKRVLADNSYMPFKHLKRDGQETEMSLDIHPYEEEINLLLEKPTTYRKFRTGNECPEMGTLYQWIETEQQLVVLAELLSMEQVFAVDVEHHSERSFLGFTALMQISIEKEDILIDTIALHDVMGILRPVFADPSICKVFHGSDNDVLWLQRDFHIYVVNMFDTAKACDVLLKPRKSLAYLLEIYCGISTDKTFQREDWRQRPLSLGMIQYARTDAHYLLYIADCLASELNKETLDASVLSGKKLSEACRRSNTACLQLYVKEIESSPGVSAAKSIYERNFNIQGVRSSSCEVKDRLAKLCAWRDIMARIHDESLRYVLSEKAIVALAAKVRKLPMEVYDVIAEADSRHDSSIMKFVPSSVVNSHLNEIFILLQGTTANNSDELMKHFRKHLAPSGCSPISVYNYALSFEFSLKGKNTLLSRQSRGKYATTVGRKTSREISFEKMACKSQAFDNKRLQWYLQRDLAKLVETDPPAVMLLFDTKARLEYENAFATHSQMNLCVGCGEKNRYIRFRVIPACYIMHFPNEMKRDYRDKVLLCVNCLEVANSATEKYKNHISNDLKIPLFVRDIVDRRDTKIVNVTKWACEIDGVRGVVRALLCHGSLMPLEKRDALEQIVREYFGGREISSQDLEMLLLDGMSPHERRNIKNKKRSDASRQKLESIARHVNTSPSGINEQRLAGEDIVDDFSLANNSGNGNQLDNIGGASALLPHKILKSPHNKLSGHGLHGKLVVEHILRTVGKDGINQFRERWRQVFIEAVRPRFLPSGWDIKHSGPREYISHTADDIAPQMDSN